MFKQSTILVLKNHDSSCWYVLDWQKYCYGHWQVLAVGQTRQEAIQAYSETI